jgi:cytidine deaminase
MKLNKKDLELIEIAKDVVRQNSDLYDNKGMHVGCVILAKSGKVYKGINIKTSHSICAEQVALGQALACGEREFQTVVSVKYNPDGETFRVVSPCGLCRYMFDKMGLGNVDIVVEDIEHDAVLKVKAEKLLPYPYKRYKGDW